MAIADEIKRLQDVKADIIAALANQLVTVPNGTLYDELPDYISSIEGLSGKIYTTYVTPSSNTQSIAVAWPYAKVPDILLISLGGRSATDYSIFCNLLYSSANGYLHFGFYEYSTSSSSWNLQMFHARSNSGWPTLTSGQLKISKSGAYFGSGVKYTVIGVYV